MICIEYMALWRLSFGCAQMCDAKRHPPLCGRGDKRVLTCSLATLSCVNLFAKRHPPLRSTGGDDELVQRILAPSAFCFDYVHLGLGLAR